MTFFLVITERHLFQIYLLLTVSKCCYRTGTSLEYLIFCFRYSCLLTFQGVKSELVSCLLLLIWFTPTVVHNCTTLPKPHLTDFKISLLLICQRGCLVVCILLQPQLRLDSIPIHPSPNCKAWSSWCNSSWPSSLGFLFLQVDTARQREDHLHTWFPC